VVDYCLAVLQIADVVTSTLHRHMFFAHEPPWTFNLFSRQGSEIRSTDCKFESGFRTRIRRISQKLKNFSHLSFLGKPYLPFLFLSQPSVSPKAEEFLGICCSTAKAVHCGVPGRRRCCATQQQLTREQDLYGVV